MVYRLGHWPPSSLAATGDALDSALADVASGGGTVYVLEPPKQKGVVGDTCYVNVEGATAPSDSVYDTDAEGRQLVEVAGKIMGLESAYAAANASVQQSFDQLRGVMLENYNRMQSGVWTNFIDLCGAHQYLTAVLK